MRTRYILPLILLCASIHGLARRPGDPLTPGFNLFSRDQDIELGREASRQILAKNPVTNDAFLQEYVNRIGQRLASQPEARKSGFQFRFTVVSNPILNAYAVPGGSMFIHTGLLRGVKSEAELAGVMSHEMSHVILRHGTNQLSKQNLLRLPAAFAQEMVGDDTLIGRLTQAGIAFGFQSAALRFSRADESEADALGCHLMAEAGYDPEALARFFSRLNEQGMHAVEFLSDHPNPDRRSEAIEEEIEAMPRRNYGYDTGQFGRARQEIEKGKAGSR